MKRTLKLKALVLSIIAVMVVGLVPSNLYAARFENQIESEAQAQAVLSLNAEKTELNPGDELVVHFSVDKSADNGIRGISVRLVYDTSKLTLEKTNVTTKEEDDDGELQDVVREYDYIEPGTVGERLGITWGKATVEKEPGDNTLNRISFANALDANKATKAKGDIVVMKFKVNEGASGPIDFYLKSTSVEDDGFALAGVKTDKDGQKVTDDSVPYYIKSNLDELKVRVPATSVRFNQSSLTLTKGQTQNVASWVEVTPDNATDTMTWRSENGQIASVDSTGTITGEGKGTTNIIVTVGDYSASLPVTVSVPVEDVVFEGLDGGVNLDVTTNPTMDISKNVKLLPDGAESSVYEWKSDDDETVSVENGVLTAHKKGDTNVSVTVAGHTASVAVHVTSTIKSVSFKKTEVALDVEEHATEDLSTADYLVLDPTDADVKSMKWSSSQPTIADVNPDTGVVTAKAPGTAVITVNADGKTATITVKVTAPVSDFEFTVDSVDLDVTNNKTTTLKDKVKFLPVGAESTDLKWSVQPEGVVEVDQDGNVTALKKGNAVIKLVVNGKIEKTINVNVTATVSSVRFLAERVTLDVTEEPTVDLSTAEYLEIKPEDADVKTKKWTSSNQEVADVDQNGKVTAKSKGTTTVTVDVDGHQASITVVVAVKLKSIEVEQSAVEVYKGDTVKVKVTASPEGAEWDKLDTSIKSGNNFASSTIVDDTVEITGLAEGTAVINVTANGGQTEELNKEITVTVKENPITSLDIVSENDEDMLRGETRQLGTTYTSKEPETVHKVTDDPTVTWTSSDDTKATVDQNGVVTALKEGNVTITAKLANGLTATYEVNIKEIHADGIEFSDETIESLGDIGSVEVGDTLEIPFKVSPENCTDTEEEIRDFLAPQFDDEFVDVEVTYDEETQEGKLTVHAKKAGKAEVEVTTGADEEGNEQTLTMAFDIVEPVVEPEEEAPNTGDMPIAMATIVMAISLAGITVSKRVFVK